MKSLLLLLVLSLPAAAAPSADARRHYKKGGTHYNLGEWAKAAEEFKLAYEQSHAAGLLFNLAQSYRHLKDWEQAAHFYRTYLSLLPNAPNHAEAERYLREAETELARPPDVPAPSPAPAAPEAPLLLETELAPSQPRAPAPTRPRGGRALAISGGVVAVVGVALLASGAALAASSASASDRIQSLSQSGGRWTPEYDSLYQKGLRDSTTGTALLATGAAVAVVGGVLAIVGAVRYKRARQPALAWRF